MKPFSARSAKVAHIFGVSAAAALAAEAGSLRDSAAKVEITPLIEWGLYNLWRTKFTGIHNAIYVRAVGIDSGTNSAAILAFDSAGNDVAYEMTEGITKASGIQKQSILAQFLTNQRSDDAFINPLFWRLM